MLGTLQDAMGMEVKVLPDFTEIPSTDLVICPLIQSSVTGCQLGAKFSARKSNKKEGKSLVLEAES